MLAGALAAGLGVLVRRRITDTLAANIVFILIPFTAYLLAESVEASGVLAAVTAGLVIGQTSPTVGTAAPRRQIFASWSLGTFILNGALFILVGIEAQTAIRGLVGTDLGQALLLVVVITVLLVVVRIGWVYLTGAVGWCWDRLRHREHNRLSARSRLINGLAGFRGAVSLAAALAVPATISTGAAFPDRDLIVFVTFGVIVLTLLQGLFLPRLVARARLGTDSEPERERALAREETTRAALDSLPEVTQRIGVNHDVSERVRRYYQFLHDSFGANDDREIVDDTERQYAALRVELLRPQREALVHLRSEHRIDDTVLLEFQARFDMEELQLLNPELDD